MKNIMNILTLFIVILFSGCVDLEFDEPPVQSGETAIANTTIADLKALHISGDFEDLSGDKIIEGVVIGDDETGNIYKGMVIQDATGGIEIRINSTGLYTDFPVGRKVYVKLNGLVMNDYNGLIQLGGGTFLDDDGDKNLAGIEPTLVSTFILKGERGNEVTPVVKTIGSLTDADVHTLIKLENVEFQNGDAGSNYADFQVNTNRTIKDCNGEELVARTSGYATFAADVTPEGNGTAIGIYTKFGTTKQFFVRTPDEIVMAGTRCGGTTGGGDTTPNTTIAELKALHTLGQFESLSGGKVIEGVITGDDASGNLYKTIIIQDATGGINVGINDFDLYTKGLVAGTKIAVKCDGLDLGDNNNLITLGAKYQVDGFDRIGGIDGSQVSNVIVVGTSNNQVTPAVKSITELTAADEQTLITLSNVEFVSADAGQSFADAANSQSLNRTVLDCDLNEMVIRTSGYASFADNLTPTGNGTATAIYTVFGDTKQLILRNPNELSMTAERCTGGSTGGGDVVFEENFEGHTQYDILDLSGWANIAEVGSDEQRWYANAFGDDQYASISAYQSVDDDNTNWLITPTIDATSAKTLSFVIAQHHWQAGGLTVLISDNFDGTDVTTANWEEVTCTLPTESNDWYEWVNSGDIQLQDYFSTGNVRVAFKYVGNKDTNSTGYNINNVTVKE